MDILGNTGTDQAAGWGNWFNDTFTILRDSAVEKYLKPKEPITQTVEVESNPNPKKATVPATATESVVDFVTKYQQPLLLGFGALLLVGLVLRK